MDRVRADLRARAQRASVHRRAEALAIAAVPATVIPARRGPFAGWSVRRASFATAASLVLGVSIATTTFAASRAGGPLYASRIWVDTATLPAEPGPRLQAELAFAETRLAEASAAAANDDVGGVTAALDAFNGIIVMTADEQAARGAAPGVALQAFQHHLAVLQGLRRDGARNGTGSADARPGGERQGRPCARDVARPASRSRAGWLEGSQRLRRPGWVRPEPGSGWLGRRWRPRRPGQRPGSDTQAREDRAARRSRAHAVAWQRWWWRERRGRWERWRRRWRQAAVGTVPAAVATAGAHTALRRRTIHRRTVTPPRTRPATSARPSPEARHTREVHVIRDRMTFRAVRRARAPFGHRPSATRLRRAARDATLRLVVRT